MAHVVPQKKKKKKKPSQDSLFVANIVQNIVSENHYAFHASLITWPECENVYILQRKDKIILTKSTCTKLKQTH